MRTSLLAFLLIAVGGLGAPHAQAQFAIGVGGVQSDHGDAIAVDATGNVYITGWFNSTVDFDPGPGVTELATTGSESTFVASYDATGALRYAIAIGGSISNVFNGGDIAVDAAGNVYVTGSFIGTAVDFDPGAGETLLNSQDGRIFVASYDSGGDLRWAFNVGGGVSNVLEGGTGVALDASGNVFVTGIFNGLEDFDPDRIDTPFAPGGPTDAFLASYTSTGGYRFAFPMGGSLADRALGIAIDASGNSYITGSFQGTADFNPTGGEALVTSEGGEDIFLASYDPSGTFRYVVGAGSASSGAQDIGQDVAVDASGNAFITGFFGNTGGSTIDFDPGAGETLLSSEGNEDLFLASYDGSGALRFAFNLGTQNGERGHDVAVDGDGNVHITGTFPGMMDFDPGAGTQIVGASRIKAFVASYTHTGLYRSAGEFRPSNTSGSSGYGIALDGSGQTHVIGDFSGTVDFDPGAGTEDLTTTGSDDIFVSSYGATLVASEPTAHSTESLSLSVAVPNPSAGHARLDLQVNQTQPVRAELVDALGRRVAVLFDGMLTAGTLQALELADGALPSGLYVVHVRGADGTVRQPVIISR